MTPTLKQSLDELVREHPVLLFMKGTRKVPGCGFSARVVQILDGVFPDYATVNVLESPELREGIKEYSSWPTIPQLYVRGEFIGGCDIVTELYQSGELGAKLGVAEPAPPSLTITRAAAAALREALGNPNERVRFEVSPGYENALSVGPTQPGDLQLDVAGVPLVMDRMSAARANGASIDLVETPQGPAFKIQNPNEPPRVRELSPPELAARMKAGEDLRLIDVRTPEERRMARIHGAEPLDEQTVDTLLELDPETTLVFQCHHGIRSRAAAEQFVAKGFRSVYNLTGGIDAWSRDVDPSVARY